MDKVEDTKRFLGEGVTKEEKSVEHMTEEGQGCDKMKPKPLDLEDINGR